MPYRTGFPLFDLLALRGRRAAGLAALGAALALAGAVLPATPADAQGARSKGEAAAASKRKARTQAARETSARTRSKAKASETAARPPDGPLVINVSLSRQRLTVYDATNKPIASSPVSSGRRGHATPTGVFTVLQKRRHHISNIYNVAMPNMQRLTWSGIALHAGVLPGYPASSGCIRLPHGFSRQLFSMTKLGTRVIVSRDPVAPVAIAHERLFHAYPPEDVVAARRPEGQAMQLADASHATGGGASDTVSAVLGVSTAHAAEPAEAQLPPSRVRFLERRQAEAAERDRAIRAAGYAWGSKRALLTQAKRATGAAQAPLVAARAEAERLEAELGDREKSVARAARAIERLENPEPEPRRGRRNAKRKTLSEAERAERIAELRAEIAAVEPEIATLQIKARAAAEVLAAAEADAREAERARKAAVNAYTEAKAAMDQALAREEAAKRREAKRDLPVSVFISRARQRLYVRQGYDDIFDVEVAIARPDDPIGTHVFTALDYAPETGGMRWNVVSVPHDPSRTGAAKQQRKAKGKAEEAPPPPRGKQTAAAALERITIPEDAREAIADVMKPGSSLVISDLRIGNETGKYTDFIVPIR